MMLHDYQREVALDDTALRMPPRKKFKKNYKTSPKPPEELEGDSSNPSHSSTFLPAHQTNPSPLSNPPTNIPRDPTSRISPGSNKVSTRPPLSIPTSPRKSRTPQPLQSPLVRLPGGLAAGIVLVQLPQSLEGQCNFRRRLGLRDGV